jgi:hypothetical protein
VLYIGQRETTGAKEKTTMNDKLKDLCIKAGYMEDGFGFGHWDMPECQKLATLIVVECMDVFGKDLPEPGGDGKMMEVVNRICNVAEHFGVGE